MKPKRSAPLRVRPAEPCWQGHSPGNILLLAELTRPVLRAPGIAFLGDATPADETLRRAIVASRLALDARTLACDARSVPGAGVRTLRAGICGSEALRGGRYKEGDAFASRRQLRAILSADVAVAARECAKNVQGRATTQVLVSLLRRSVAWWCKNKGDLAAVRRDNRLWACHDLCQLVTSLTGAAGRTHIDAQSHHLLCVS